MEIYPYEPEIHVAAKTTMGLPPNLVERINVSGVGDVHALPMPYASYAAGADAAAAALPAGSTPLPESLLHRSSALRTTRSTTIAAAHSQPRPVLLPL